MSNLTETESIASAKQRWQDGPVAKTIARFPEQREEFVTASGRPVERLYTPEDGVKDRYNERLGFPGMYPYTRGVQPTMYRGRFWTMRQYAGFATAEESNKRYRYLLDQGAKGLSVAFDLPTQIGYDSDDDMSLGEVGKVGVAIDSLADMEALFDGIPLDQVSTSMTINSTASILLAMYIAVAEKQGVTPDKLSGTIQNDILKEYIARGTYRFPPGPSLRLTSDIFAYCTENVPGWNTISISGYHIREAGSTAGEEIGFTLANAVCYIETAIKAGLKVDDFAPRLAFFFAAHSDLLEEVAKFRAARRLYARIMKERFGATNPKSQMLRFHTQTGGVTLTAQQPDNNVVRVAIQALAAVLGGAQSLHTNSKDEALALPTEESVTVALRTQQIIAHESGVTNTIDPLAGSFFLEKLTDDLEAEAEAIIAEIDRKGGMPTAIEQRYVQKRIEESAYKFGQSIDRGDRVIVGVNKFATDEQPKMDLFEVPEATTQRQVDRVRKVRDDRDEQRVTRALDAVGQAAQGDDNLMPPILEAVRAYATVGEVCRALSGVFGEYEESFQ
ncbi:Methylmalonyl-CoA mutase [Posidoniimonas polymericola]|uniref:Methylmalonyl-CoA mutase n=1 Tax=Posidoniimonas polymericola TaxID=2528002 RepID=A0A5C5XWS5_9BACT|nr:methylmalonyl-CoA mutase family protein [Posidoniimonas polymericola]TWT66969.1 Methylmalonyl-CoA mutase [Posidoniimonas polymericola]